MLWRFLPLGALLLALPGCQCIGQAFAVGSITEGITIQAGTSSSGGRIKLLELAIQDSVAGAGDMARWYIRGAATVASVRYGVAPTGTVEASPALPLEPGHTYRIIGRVESGSLLSPRCQVMGSFHVDIRGKVTDAPERAVPAPASLHLSQEGTAVAHRPPPNLALQRTGDT